MEILQQQVFSSFAKYDAVTHLQEMPKNSTGGVKTVWWKKESRIFLVIPAITFVEAIIQFRVQNLWLPWVLKKKE